MKKTLTVLLSVFIVAALFAGCTAKDNNSTTAATEAVTQVQTTAPTTAAPAPTASATEAQTEVSATETTAEKETKNKNAFIEKGAWYLYDEENRTAYAFRFNSDKVKIAFFDSDNTDGLDAKYFTGNEKYSASENKISFEDPMNASRDIELTVKDNKLYYNGKALSHEKETSLEIAFNHFNS